MTGQEIAESEMICGGYVKIYVEFLSSEALPTVRELHDRYSKNGEVLFLTWIENKKRSFEETHYISEPAGKMN
jgi:hypothetical protein